LFGVNNILRGLRIAEFAHAVRAKRRYIFVALLAAWGISLSIMAFAAVRGTERDRFQNEFALKASDRVAALDAGIESHLAVLHSLQSFFSASEQVTREEFGVFVHNEFTTHPGIQALEWIPLVTAEERTNFEASVRAEGFSDFQIVERQILGDMTPARNRVEHFPVSFVEPYIGNEVALGFDLASSPARLASLREARDSGRAVATQRVVLVQEIEDQFGFLVFVPIYEKNAPVSTIEQRRNSLIGFVLGAFRVRDLVGGAWASAGLMPLTGDSELFLFDRSAPEGSQTLSISPGEPEVRATPAESFAFTSFAGVGGRTWEATVTTSQPSLLIIWQPWSALLAGLSLTGLVVAYVLSAVQRESRTQLLVDQRTHELSEMNQQLEEEIIDRSRAQQEERRVLSIIEHSPDFIGMADMEGRIKFINEAGLALVGLSKIEDAQTRSMFDFIFQDDLPIFRSQILPVVAESTFWEGEIRFRNFSDDSYTPMRASIFSTLDPATGATTGFATVSQDVTQRKAVEDALREREARLRGVVESAVNGIITIDESGDVESFNPGAEVIFGYPAAEVLGQNVKMLMPEPYLTEHDGYLNAYKTTGEKKIIGQDREVFGLRKDGIVFPLDLSISEVDLLNRKLYTWIIRDATERKALEREIEEYTKSLEKAYEELQTLDKMKDEFMSTVSHELRTPLTSIKGAAEFLLNYQDEDPSVQAEFLTIIDNESDRLTRLINDVLDLARMESGSMQWRMSDVDLNSVIETAIDSTHALTVLKGLTVEIIPSEDVPTVNADPDRLVQVLTNLLSNSIKFTPSGGLIQVQARLLPVPDPETRTEMVEIRVSDNGVGIPADEFGKIFNRFQQVRTSLSDRPQGTGLGLPISKEIVEYLGGAIWVESELGKGSTFFFTVPVEQSPIQPDDESAGPDTSTIPDEIDKTIGVEQHPAVADSTT